MMCDNCGTDIGFSDKELESAFSVWNKFTARRISLCCKECVLQHKDNKYFTDVISLKSAILPF